MIGGVDRTFGLIGALTAYSRRAIAREVERQGGQIHHRVTRRTNCVVFGRSLLSKLPEAAIEERQRSLAASGRALMSEHGLLRLLGLIEISASRTLPKQAMIDQSRLSARDFDLLCLFDAFEADADPFTFRDLVLARKYAQLLSDGVSWGSIAKSVHRSGALSSLPALNLQAPRGTTIYSRSGDTLSELNGQALLPLDEAGDLEDRFALAEEAEEAGRYLEASELYEKCLAAEPTDAVASYNRANCLKALGSVEDARLAYLRAIKVDPKFVEAWFNLGCLALDSGDQNAARRYLRKAISLDPTYGDAVYNLASLEFAAADFGEARRLWACYLELDSDSDWARTATKGILYADRQLNTGSAS